MTKRWAALVLALGLVLSGCGKKQDVQTAAPAAQEQTVSQTTAPVETAPPATTPPDGNPEDVTCKGTYTGQGNADAVVATVGEKQLTNGMLSAYYWAEVSQYRSENRDQAPDFDAPLDTQVCTVESSVASWQQYFLKRALNSWYTAQAMALEAEEKGLPKEEAYKPNLQNYEIYLTDIPATKFLYGYSDTFRLNTMHQEYLDNLPQTLETLAQEKGYASAEEMAQKAFGTTLQNVQDFAWLYNYGYMYMTSLSYDLAPTQEEVESYFAQQESTYQSQGITRDSGKYVDIHHLLVVPGQETEEEATQPVTATTEPTQPTQPVTIAADGKVSCSEEAWQACQAKAEELLTYWKDKTKETEATFAELANKNSQDTGTALDGGAYHQLRQGQLIPELDSWCFDPARQPGDTTIIRTEYGCHILYFTGSTDIWYAQAEQDLKSQMQNDILAGARENHPMDVDYSAIVLPEAESSVGTGDVLYPDVAHERFPEVPLYLQQDYAGTMFGGFKLSTNGCGITSMAMLASYLADEEWTPPEMCARYGYYSFSNGTDGMIFVNEPPVLGFYLKEKTYEPTVAKQALDEGHIVISIQHKGYWTKGGHYIVLEKVNEDGTIQVRDSNIYNYGRIASHKEDRHTWASITSAGSGYWIFEYKITNIPVCARCGEPEKIAPQMLTQDYTCHKCAKALLRRQTYLGASDF